MAQRLHNREKISTAVRQIGMLVGQGMLVTEAIQQIGISDSTYYRWRAELRAKVGEGNPDPGQAQKVRRLETENNHLRHALADLLIEKQALRETSCGTS